MKGTPIFDALKAYSEISSAYFRIPGHRFERGIPARFTDFAGKNIFRLDVTETPMTDDLHNPHSVIAESEAMTAEIFGADRSFYLVNGTTCGNEAMIIGCAGEGEKIVIPRNAHKSVLAGLIFSGAVPVYTEPGLVEGFGFAGSMNPGSIEKALAAHPDAKAVFAVSPNYHGVCSNLRQISEAAHRRNIPLLVDEAHGAHFVFSDILPETALSCGADACAQSLHKTAGALTQSSLLHLGTGGVSAGRIDKAGIDSALRMTMSTSPSYLLMASIELAVAELHSRGAGLMEKSAAIADTIRRSVADIDGFSCFSPAAGELLNVHASDPTRVVINCSGSGLSGFDLKTILWKEFNIDVELADPLNIVLIITYGNSEEDSEKLTGALQHISSEYIGSIKSGRQTGAASGMILPAIPEAVLSPRQAYYSDSVNTEWKLAEGRVSAEAIIPYPPGIPVINPGELISPEVFRFVGELKKRKIHIHGPADKSLSTIRVINL